MKVQILEDGSLAFPKRGLPPDDMPGYVRDLGDQYLFHPKIPECIHRQIITNVLPCGRCHTVWRCDKLNSLTSVKQCRDCKIYESPIQQP